MLKKIKDGKPAEHHHVHSIKPPHHVDSTISHIHKNCGTCSEQELWAQGPAEEDNTNADEAHKLSPVTRTQPSLHHNTYFSKQNIFTIFTHNSVILSCSH